MKDSAALLESPFVIVSPSDNNKEENKELMKKLIKCWWNRHNLRENAEATLWVITRGHSIKPQKHLLKEQVSKSFKRGSYLYFIYVNNLNGILHVWKEERVTPVICPVYFVSFIFLVHIQGSRTYINYVIGLNTELNPTHIVTTDIHLLS